jgi:glucose-1-phosphate cytidylyltransferase
MKAIILAGGLGTRMREETEFRPKPMVEIGGRPMLWHIMSHLSAHGVSDFVVAVGHKGEVVKDYFANYRSRNQDFTVSLGLPGSIEFHGDDVALEQSWTVTVADTGPETLTAGRISRVAKYLDDEPFLVAYGDGLSNVDVGALLATHRRQGRLATLTVAQPSSRYGVVDLNDEGAVRSFQEKPALDGWVNIGYFVFEPGVLSYLTDDEPLEQRPLTLLAHEGRLSAYRHRGFWQPMDTFKEAEYLNRMWFQGNAPWSRTQ